MRCELSSVQVLEDQSVTERPPSHAHGSCRDTRGTVNLKKIPIIFLCVATSSFKNHHLTRRAPGVGWGGWFRQALVCDRLVGNLATASHLQWVVDTATYLEVSDTEDTRTHSSQ